MEWWYCLVHLAVEQGTQCANAQRLGPFETRDDAEHVIERMKARNKTADQDDED